MRLKIGTLGTMQADFVSLKIENACIIATMGIDEGVKWEVVSEVSYEEVWKILRTAMRFSILWYLVSGWFKKKNSKS